MARFRASPTYGEAWFQGASCSPLTSELKRLAIMGSHWDPDGDHCEGTSHGIARHSWYRSPHRGADSSQVPFLPCQPEAPTQNLQSSLKYSPRSRPVSVLRVKSWHPPGTASFFLYTKPLPAAFIPARAETPVFNHPSSLSAQRSWDFSQGRKPVWAHLCSSTVQWLQGLGSAQRCELSWISALCPG